MQNRKEKLEAYENWLRAEEKSKATVEKYRHSVEGFLEFAKKREITKELVISYKKELMKRYAPTGVNGKLAAINGFLGFIGREACRVKNLKIQRQMFVREERELTRAEYQRLVGAAGNSQISLAIQTIGSTGIRVSELEYITEEAVLRGETVVSCKNKIRYIFIPKKVCQMLKQYIKKTKIKSGSIFVTKSGKPLDRSYIWRKMKELCEKAGVSPKKVFPHNLRHLFARTFYTLEKDIVRLADMLGHSNIQTTRIYTIESGAKHKKGLERVYRVLEMV